MLTYPDIDPVAVAIGPLKVHWYGLMYLVGFAAAWLLGRWRASRPGSIWSSTWTTEMVDDLIFYCVVGTIAGGRLGYMFFYGFDQILANPLNVLKVWEGGMSFHGGLIGVLIAVGLFARKYRLRYFQVGDFLVPLVPLGLLAGRIGNFINGELWGHATSVAWGMRLPCDRFPQYCAGLPVDAAWSLPLHASQLYEATLEGWCCLWFCGGSQAARAPSWPCRGCFCCSMACSASVWSSSVCRMPTSAISPSTGSPWARSCRCR